MGVGGWLSGTALQRFCSVPPPQAAQFSLVTFCNFPCNFLSQLFVGSFPRGQSAPSSVGRGTSGMVLRLSEGWRGVLFVPGTNSLLSFV